MKIYTKKGDSGQTSLIGGTRVSKSSLRIEAYGTIDELNSWIGLIACKGISEKQISQLLEIQDRLFTIGSLLAVGEGGTKMSLPHLNSEDVEYLEKHIDTMESELEPMKNFVLPGGNEIVSHTHIARCICRRAERMVIGLAEIEKVDNILIMYLNRLSDYLFVLSRYFSKQFEAVETPWKPRI